MSAVHAPFSPPEVDLPERRPGDPRVGHLLGESVEPDRPPRAVLIGFPSDEGVRRNGGRTGASDGPAALRRWLYGSTPDARNRAMGRLLARTADLGDVRVTGDVEDDQRRLADALAPHLERGAFAVVMGGGHETTFGHFLAYPEAGLSPAILNWDAHPDVRDLRDGRGHSGSPFRQALLHASGACRGYRVAGLLPHAVARSHLEFLEQRGATWRWRDEVDAEAVEAEASSLDAPSLVSFDLDAVDGAHAPGVSAPATGGLDARTWLRAAEAVGERPAVRSADVVELNPRHDEDGRTARLAALTVWRLLTGLSRRPENAG